MIELLKRNILWLMMALIIVGFVAIAMQSNDKPEDLDPEFVNVGRDAAMYMGDENAPVHVVMYTDFLCPYCADFASDVMPLVQESYIETGKAQIEVRPVAMIGLDSDIAAEAAFCAADQDQFWAIHDALYDYTKQEIASKGINAREQSVLTADMLAGLADGKTDMNADQFKNCLVTRAQSDLVGSATADATSRGVSGTPYVMVNGNHILNPTYEMISSVIKAQL